MDTVNGWVITDHPTETGEYNREGVGQTNKEVVLEDADRIYARTVTIEIDIDPNTIKQPIKFKLYTDDEDYEYGGYISKDWLDGEEALAFAPLHFAEADAGCTIMKYYEYGEWKYL